MINEEAITHWSKAIKYKRSNIVILGVPSSKKKKNSATKKEEEKNHYIGEWFSYPVSKFGIALIETN